jgi:hypothetical protein
MLNLITGLISLTEFPLISSKAIEVNSSTLIKDNNLIAFFINSYPIIVSGPNPVLDLFDSIDGPNLYQAILKKNDWPGNPRGVPPFNWVKFESESGVTFGLFGYKTVNYCSKYANPKPNLYDSISNVRLLRAYNNTSNFYKSRTMLGRPLAIHSLATDAIELYSMDRSYKNFTHLPGAHSDIRVIPFARNCRYFDSSAIYKSARYVFVGAVQDHDWHEQQFLAIMDENFNIIISKILVDPLSPSARTQKNWMPFWDGCRLMFSKRYGPEHVVAEFNRWRSTELVIEMPDTVKSWSPAIVPSEYFIRGSAPVVKHHLFEKDFAIGCVHLKGVKKIYRHALYVMETSYPYRIVSYSPLFAFKPYHDIEFVMSINVVRKDGSLELTHGSMDCESRLAIFPIERLQVIFREFFKVTN